MCACSLSHVQLLLTLRHSFSSKTTGVGYHFLLQGIFPTQESNTHLHWQANSLPSEPPEKPRSLSNITLNIGTPSPSQRYSANDSHLLLYFAFF